MALDLPEGNKATLYELEVNLAIGISKRFHFLRSEAFLKACEYLKELGIKYSVSHNRDSDSKDVVDYIDNIHNIYPIK